MVAQAISDIATNTHAGAVELAAKGADVLLRDARSTEATTPDLFKQEIIEIGWGLIRAQPAMAPLVNLVNDTLWQLEEPHTLDEMRTIVTGVARDFKRQLQVRESAIAEAVLPLIVDGARVLTLSRSTTVKAALRHAQRAGRRFRVLCAEARPGLEGRTMAAELAEDGIAVTLMVDMLALSQVARADVVLIGADHLTTSGLVNKVGTYGLALATRANNVPLYALCGSEKFLPPGYIHPAQESRPAAQVWDDVPEAVQIENYYFDRTPLSDITSVVTESGVLTSAAIEGWLASIKLHPELRVDHLP
jgi:translation initiation factor 2B subunit (eIF-2B alpha/beta/delta family)